MKKFITMVVSFALMAAALTGCGSSDGASAGKGTETGKTASSQTVATDGSTSMEKVIGFLSEAYMEEHGNIKVTYNPTGSGSGIQAAAEGRCDIGLASCDLKEEEAADLQGMVVAIDGIGIIVNPNNSVTDLTIEQIGKIYSGEITNWKELGGSDAPIVCIGREAASGTRDGFEEVTGTKDKYRSWTCHCKAWRFVPCHCKAWRFVPSCKNQFGKHRRCGNCHNGCIYKKVTIQPSCFAMLWDTNYIHKRV